LTGELLLATQVVAVLVALSIAIVAVLVVRDRRR
jgi:hypothetical protein